MIKIVNATSEIPGMTREEVETFLESKLNLQLATIDQKGEPGSTIIIKSEKNLLLVRINQPKKLRILEINLLFIFQ